MVLPPRVSALARRRQSSTRAERRPAAVLPLAARAPALRTELPDRSRRDSTRSSPRSRLLPSENVLEIGPGRGALTEALLDAVPAIVAIEIDRDLACTLAPATPTIACA